MRLYGFPLSGNCYKVRLCLNQLGIPYEYEYVDIMKLEARTPEFLAKNPDGKIPVLEYRPGRFLPESNAILTYLAEGTKLLSDDPVLRAHTLRWLFFEQASIEVNLATARFWVAILKDPEPYAALLEDKHRRGYLALKTLERHLTANGPFVVESGYSIADIALYAYIHVCEEGGFELEKFEKVREWLEAVRSQKNHIGIESYPK